MSITTSLGPHELPPSSPPPAEDAENLFEIIDGKRVEMRPMGAYEALVGFRLAVFLAGYAQEHELGQATAETLFRIPSADRNRRPDVAFVTYARWPKGRRIPRGDAWDVVPDLAVEVISPYDTTFEQIDKMREYFAAGVRLVWVVLTNTSQVHVYRSMEDVCIVSRGGTLDGGDVLPGFALPLSELFDPEEAPAG